MILAALAALAMDAPAGTVAAQPATSPSPVGSLVLPAGTPVRLTTVGPLDSRSVNQGQRFALTLADDVMVGSVIAIPRGTAAVGEVEAVSGKGMFGKAARLRLIPLFIDYAGERVNLVGSTSERGKDATTAAAITTAITPFGLFITGKSATVPPGSLLLGRVRTDATLPVGVASSSTAPAATTEAAKQ